MNPTREQFDMMQERLARGRKFDHFHENNPHSPLPNAEPQRDQTPALGAAGQREAQGMERTIVSFTGYRVRPLDPDNFAASVKDLLDGCRHSGAIYGDEPWRIKLITDQVKVAHFTDEKTVIEIITT